MDRLKSLAKYLRLPFGNRVSSPAILCAGFLVLTAAIAAAPRIFAETGTSTTATLTPTVNIKINGSDNPSQLTAPASYTVYWTSSNATSCSTSGTAGSQMGAPETGPNGYKYISGQVAGTYTYTITCDSVSDSVTVYVNNPVVYTGLCMLRSGGTAIPTTLPYPDLGTGYAKVNKGPVTDIAGIRALCTDAIYSSLLTHYCTSNTAQVTREVVMYDSTGAYYSNGTASQGGSSLSCPTGTTGGTTASTTPPAAPSGLTAIVNGSSVALRWTDNSNDETGFKLYRTPGTGGLWTEIGVVSANTTTYTDNNVTAGSAYGYKVQAFSQTGNSYPAYSGVSNVVTVTIPATATGSGTGSGSVSVDIKINGQDNNLTLVVPANYTATWTSANAVSCVTTGTWAGLTKPASGTHDFNGVTLLGTKTYGIICQDNSGHTATDTVIVEIAASALSGGSTSTTTTATTPAAPSNLVATSTSGAVRLTWSDNSSNESGFKIYKLMSGFWTQLTDVSADTASYTDNNVTVGETYKYQIQSFVQAGGTYQYSTMSNYAPVTVIGTSVMNQSPSASTTPTTTTTPATTASTTPTATVAPAAPSGLIAQANGNAVTLTWNDNSLNETNFKIYKTIGGLWTELVVVSANTTAYNDNRVQAGMSYSYKVQAFAQRSGSYPAYSGISNIATVTVIGTQDYNTSSTTVSTAAKIMGTVTDASGQPVSKVGVHVYSSDYSINLGAVTDDKGGFSLWVQPGSFLVEILPPSGRTDLIKPQPQALTAAAGQTLALVLHFKAAQDTKKAVSGTVLTTTGKPVADAIVGAYNASTGQWLSDQTDSSGAYSLLLGPGTWKFGLRPVSTQAAAWQWMYVTVEQSFADNGISETRTVNFTVIEATGKITVTATDPSGAPMAGAGITLYPAVTGGSASQFKKTESNGQAVFFVMPGTYSVSANVAPALGYINPPKLQVSVTSGQEQSAAFVFKKPDVSTAAAVSGTVILEGSVAAEGAGIWAWSEQGGVASAQSGSTGSFTLTLAIGQRWHIGAGKVINNFPYKAAETVLDVSAQGGSVSLILVQMSTAQVPAAVAVSKPASEPVIVQTNGGAGVVVPANSAAGASTLQVQVSPSLDTPSQQSARVVGTVFDINAKDQNGAEVTKLENEVEVILPYTREDLVKQGISEDRLSPSYYDEAAGVWVKLDDYTIDMAGRKIIARVRHFTRFALVAPADVTAPLTPLNVKGYRTAKAELTVMWTDPKVDFHHAKVYRSTSARDVGTLVDPIETESFFKDTDVKVGKRYYYRVVAVDAAGNESGFAKTLSVTVSGSVKKLPQPPKNTTFTKYLSKGRKDQEVKFLKQALQSEGLYPLSSPVSDVYDADTVALVKKFQASRGIKQSGVLDTTTRKELNKL